MSYEPNLYFAMLKCFKISLTRFLCHHSFYTIKEYYEHNKDKRIQISLHELCYDKISIL